MKIPGGKKARGEIFAALSLITQMGLTTAVCIGGSILLGHWLDEKFGTAPLFLLIMLLIGFGGAIRGIFTMTRRFRIDDKKK